MKDVIILGSGGHSKVVLDILIENNEYKIAGIIDDSTEESFMGFPILGNDSVLPNIFNSGITKCFVAIGNNNIRKKLHKNLIAIGFEFINAISKYSIISRFAHLGTGNVVMPGAIINQANIGDGCIINTNSSVDHDCNLGDFIHIAPSSTLAGNVNIGECSFLGVGTKVIDKISICNDVILGAGSTVIKDIVLPGTYVGTPARQIKSI